MLSSCRRKIVCGIGAALFAGLASFGPAEAEAKTLRFAVSTFGEDSFDPTVTSIVAAVGLGGGVWSWLTEMDAQGTLKPSVATSWSEAPDRLSWTFKLRKDVKFHDGTLATAEDVRFSLMEGFLREGAKSTRSAAFRATIADVKAIDPETVRFELKKPWPTLPHDLSNSAGTEGILLPKAYIKSVGWAEFAKKPVGSGPWKFVGKQLGSMAEFSAVKDHFAYPPKFDTLQIFLVPEEATRFAMLRTNEIDIADVQIESLKQISAAGFKIAENPQLNSIRVTLPGSYLDPAKPVYKLEVRKALNLAINRDEIVQALFDGHGRAAAVSPSSALSIGFPKELKPYPYNPQEAKRLLKEAGYPNGFEIKLFAYSVSGFNMHQPIAEAVAGYWEAIGVKTTIVSTDFGAIRPKYMADPPPADLQGQAMLFANPSRLNGADDLSAFWYNTPRGNMRLAAKGEIDAEMQRADKAANLDELAKAVTDGYTKLYNHYRGIPLVDGLSAMWAYGNQLADITYRRPFRGSITPDLALAVPK